VFSTKHFFNKSKNKQLIESSWLMSQSRKTGFFLMKKYRVKTAV